jgi:methyl-accepting chemotaxis protein
MNLNQKVSAVVIGGVAMALVAAIVVQHRVVNNQGIELMRDTMRAAVIEAENVRASISDLNHRGAFDREKLLAEYKASGDLRGSSIYSTIPVVAAWRAIEEAAKKNDWEFRVPKHQARNPANEPTAEETAILATFEKGNAEEYFEVNRAANQIVFARPIKLTSDCLACHGSPANSPTGDGRDILGFKMEDWRAGEVHGAFVLKAKLDRVDQVAKAGMFTAIGWMIPVCAVVIGLAYLYMRRTVVRPLETAIASINAASVQEEEAARAISSTSQRLAEGASEQAASLEETSATMEEISSMTKRNTENAATAQELAGQTFGAAETGAKEMERMQQAMGEIKAASDNISKIIKSIDEIAFQTNILALNAAVEAARAGEAGAGFAVVADEVRSLAQRSALAAKETADKIADSISKSEHGVQITERMSKTLDTILERARRMDEIVKSITQASREQDTGIGQVNTALAQLDKLTQGTAASSEEAAAAAEELNAQSMELKAAVSDLFATISGTRPQASAPQPADPLHTTVSGKSSVQEAKAAKTAKAPKKSAAAASSFGEME